MFLGKMHCIYVCKLVILKHGRLSKISPWMSSPCNASQHGCRFKSFSQCQHHLRDCPVQLILKANRTNVHQSTPTWKPSARRGSREQLLQGPPVLPFSPFTVNERCLWTGCHPTACDTSAFFCLPDTLVTWSFVHLKKKQKEMKRKAGLWYLFAWEADLKRKAVKIKWNNSSLWDI